MNSASFRKNRFFGPGRRVAAPEGPKIAGGASLARRENRLFRSWEAKTLSRSRAPALSSF